MTHKRVFQPRSTITYLSDSYTSVLFNKFHRRINLIALLLFRYLSFVTFCDSACEPTSGIVAFIASFSESEGDVTSSVSRGRDLRPYFLLPTTNLGWTSRSDSLSSLPLTFIVASADVVVAADTADVVTVLLAAVAVDVVVVVVAIALFDELFKLL
jgi:hypothetical protein